MSAEELPPAQAGPTGSVESEDPKRQAIDRLNELASRGGDAQLLEVFSHHLGGEISDRTWDDVYRGVDIVVGYPILVTLLWGVQASADEFPAVFEREGFDEPAQRLLSRILSLYGGGLQDAYFKSTRDHTGDDWELIRPDVALHARTGEHVVSTLIRKNNRESMVVRGGADSLIRWSRIMLEALLKIGEREVFSTSDVERFVPQLERVRALFLEEPESDSLAQGETPN